MGLFKTFYMKKSVTVNNISYNAEHAQLLGKEKWSKEVAGDFGGDTGKAGAAHDSIIKQLESERKQEQKDADQKKTDGEKRSAAQKELDARGTTSVVAGPATGETK